jgi:C-C chemokine receptor type 6
MLNFIEFNIPNINFSDPNNTESFLDYMEREYFYIYDTANILYGISCAFGFLFNTIVVIVMLYSWKLLVATDIYVLNMSLANILFLMACPFYMTYFHNRTWKFGETLCKWGLTITSSNQVAGSFLLFVLSADQYMVICRPLLILGRRWKEAIVVSLITWTISAILLTPMYIYSSLEQHYLGQVNLTSCVMHWPKMIISGRKAYLLYLFTIAFIIPFILIVIFSVPVIRRLFKTGPRSSQEERRILVQRRIFYLVLAIIVVYFTFQLPQWISEIWYRFYYSEDWCNNFEDKPCSTIAKTNVISGSLSFGHTAINPIFFAFLTKNFATKFKLLLTNPFRLCKTK